MDIRVKIPIPEEDLNFILNSYQKGNFENKIGEGSYAIIYRYKHYAIKCFTTKDDTYTQDPLILEKLQNIPAVSKLYFYIPNKLIVTEFIDGATVIEAKYKNVKACENWLDIISETITSILRKRIKPFDLTSQNIMFRQSDGYPFIVDVGEFNSTRYIWDKYSKKEILTQLERDYIIDYKKFYL